MKNKLLILIAFLGMLSFYACENDETKAILSATPVVPTLDEVSDLVLARDKSADSIFIKGKEADFGYTASVLYILEAAVKGTDFAEPIELQKMELVNSFKFTVNSLNSILIETLPEDEVASLELRVRAEIISSETGGADKIMSSSAVQDISIKTYGPPSLYVTGDTHNQRLVSANDDGVYTGWVYTDGTAFTLTNRDDSKVYGVTDGTVTEGGDAIELEAGGWVIEINLNASTMDAEDKTVGIIGSSVGGWDNDTKMIWDFDDHTWNITKDVISVADNGIKFRTHNSWAEVNVAYHPDNHDLMNLYQANSEEGKGDSQNIDDIPAGTYVIKASLESTPMWATFTPVK